MSLFGGEESAQQSPEISPTALLPERSPTPPNVQNPPLVSFTLDSDEDDNSGDEDEGSELLSDEEPSRPNRFTGKSQTWRGYTAADRQIAASLEEMESADLAAHLYNAHHLKRRVRRPTEHLGRLHDWRAKDSWLKKGRELDFTDPFGEIQTELVPGKVWTAWPVAPKLIPTKEPGVGRADSEEDTWYIEGAGARDAGEVMREEILALFLRQAKEAWIGRDFESSGKDEVATPKRKSRAKSEAKSVRLERSQSVASDAEMHDADIRERTAAASESDAEEKFANILGKTRGRKLQPPSAKVAFLADDDEARRLLQPSINSLLARLDHLALAVRRSRLNHYGKGAYSDRSGSDFTSDAESVASDARAPPRSRSKGQVAKKAISKLSAARRSSGSESISSLEVTGAEGNDENSSSDGSQTSKRQRATSKRPRKGSDSSSNNSHREVSKQYGLMDWSEVLGLASVTGWDQQAVERTAQRCAALFGEGMSFRTFDASASTIPEPVHYNPTTIPAPEDSAATASWPSPKRPYFDIGAIRCPHKDCWGSKQDFAIPYRVVEHLMRVHGYDPRTNDSDNEERKVGGVHIDGFLQPISAKQGWLGGGRAKGGGKKTDSGKGKAKGMGQKKQKTASGASSPVIIDDSEY
jgi:hypothetical protein